MQELMFMSHCQADHSAKVWPSETDGLTIMDHLSLGFLLAFGYVLHQKPRNKLQFKMKFIYGGAIK